MPREDTAGHILGAAARELQLRGDSTYAEKTLLPMLNRVYEHIWGMEWATLNEYGSLTIAADASTIVLPKRWSKLLYLPKFSTISTVTTYSDKVSVMRMGRTRWLQQSDMLYGASFIGEVGAYNQPAAADIPKILSSSADDKGIEVYISGFLSNEPVHDTITTDETNGTTAAAGTKQFDRIEAVSKGTKTVGNISIKSNDLATVYSVISDWETSAYYAAYQLDTLLTAAKTTDAWMKRRFLPFVSSLSVPFMSGLTGALIDGVKCMAEAEYNQMEYAGVFKQLMDARLRDLRSAEVEPMEEPQFWTR